MKTEIPKKLAILSDIHGNIPALEAVVADLRKKRIEDVINLGDHISGPLWPIETINFLKRQKWIHIAGNHDRNLVNLIPDKMGASDYYAFQFLTEEDKNWLDSLPDKFKRKNLIAFHGTLSDDNVYLLEEVWNGRSRLSTQSEIGRRLGKVNREVILCGHTHIPRSIVFKDSVIINPGSVGLQAYDDVIPEYHIMETGSNHACYAILNYENKKYSIEQVSVKYDYKSAVKRALKNNRHDWAAGLQSGFLPEKK